MTATRPPSPGGCCGCWVRACCCWADRAFDSATFLAEVDRTGAKLLVRAGCSRKPAVLRHLPDGSYLSQLAGLHIRIIEAELTVRGTDGTTVADHYRLITTLLDDRRFPATELIQLYHERWGAT